MIATTTIEENILILSEVLKIMSENLLELRLDKCSFLEKKILYLGYLITQDGILPNPQNVQAVNDYPLPNTPKKLHRFLGLASYFRRFIPSFALLAKPLFALIRKNSKFNFSEEHLNSFNAIKSKLVESPILSVYSPNLETEVHCDASSAGYGAILMQKQSDGLFRPVFYYSRRKTDCESRYHSYELELLAVVNALNRFRVYLHGLHFKIVTDSNSIVQALSKKEINHRINRWAMILQNYDYELIHREGNKMRHVDALSRIHSIMVLDENTFSYIVK